MASAGISGMSALKRFTGVSRWDMDTNYLQIKCRLLLSGVKCYVDVGQPTSY